MVRAPASRDTVFYTIERGISQRRDCALMQMARSILNYVMALSQKQGTVVSVMRWLSGQCPRYASRRIRVFLRREDLRIGKEACQRLRAEHGLEVPKKRPRRRIAGSRPCPLAPAEGNSVRSYDFVYDACSNGQQLKCLRSSMNKCSKCWLLY
jgi:putative transposase